MKIILRLRKAYLPQHPCLLSYSIQTHNTSLCRLLLSLLLIHLNLLFAFNSLIFFLCNLQLSKNPLKKMNHWREKPLIGFNSFTLLKLKKVRRENFSAHKRKLSSYFRFCWFWRKSLNARKKMCVCVFVCGILSKTCWFWSIKRNNFLNFFPFHRWLCAHWIISVQIK